MTIEEFMSSLQEDQPPEGLDDLPAALWHDAKGDWDQAHRLAQNIDDKYGSRVHAYLHRKEGDQGNAGYWYKRAGRPFCEDSLEAEWGRLVEELLVN